jgi:methionyl-tRNA formyltransferase
VIQNCPRTADILVAHSTEAIAPFVAATRADLLLCCSFLWKLPSDVLNIPRLGAINIHDSYLPRHRGPMAIAWALREGDLETGLTVHRMEPEYDTGPILSQRKIAISLEDTVASINERLAAIAPEVLNESLDRVARGEPGLPQAVADASFAPFFEDSWKEIDWQQPARVVHNQVRSWGQEGCTGLVNGDRCTILQTRLPAAAGALTGTPGSVLRSEDGQLWIACGDGAIVVERFRANGSHASE